MTHVRTKGRITNKLFFSPQTKHLPLSIKKQSNDCRKKILFIVNPSSGNASKDDCAMLLDQHLDHQLYDFQISYTQYAGHATELSHDAVKQSFDIVVAVGGDGTINEVASALVHTDTTLGIIPSGSGNGFASHIGISKNRIKAIQSLNNGKKLTIDSCTVNGQFYINVAGVGFDGYISNLIKGVSKRGKQLYFFKMLKAIISYSSKSYNISIDGKSNISGKYYCVAIANASMYGYQFHIAPQAKLTDGLLDIVLIKHAPIYKHLWSLMYFFQANTDKIKHLKNIKAKSVLITSTETIDYHRDGEGEQTNQSLDFRIIPNSLKVIINR